MISAYFGEKNEIPSRKKESLRVFTCDMECFPAFNHPTVDYYPWLVAYRAPIQSLILFRIRAIDCRSAITPWNKWRVPVICLHYPWSPSTILPWIITKIVPSIQSRSRWPLSHVFQKILKLQPSFADPNPGILVISNLGCVWSSAALNHVPPWLIGRRFPIPFKTSVSVLFKSLHFISLLSNLAIDCNFLFPRRLKFSPFTL